jgi:hypothetical protein
MMSTRSDTTNGTAVPAATTKWEDRGLPVSISCIPVIDEAVVEQSLLAADTSSSLSSATNATTTQHQQQQALTLLFGYEFAVIDPREPVGGEVIHQDLPFLEYQLLYYVADAIGLHQCDTILDTQRAVFIQQEQQIVADDGGIPLVVGLSNLQPDEWESEIGTYYVAGNIV